ncbi:MAG: hypothetical protein QM756_39945 [Polyangiaceae bacterium]
MRQLRFATVCALVCALGGCKALLKKRDSVTTEASASAAVVASAPPPVVSAAPPPSAVASAAPADNDDAIPTSQDFEDEAFEKVTAANFKAELARLKKEIETK